MFETHPNAEFHQPLNLAPGGIRTWSWVELAISIPIFLATLVSCEWKEDETESIASRHIWLTHVDQVISLAQDIRASVRLVRLDLLSPAYMNGTDGFRLDQLHQIWRSPDSKLSMLVVLMDGRKLSFNTGKASLEEDKLELVLAI